MIDLTLLTDDEISDLKKLFFLGVNYGEDKSSRQGQIAMREGKLPTSIEEAFKQSIQLVNLKSK